MTVKVFLTALLGLMVLTARAHAQSSANVGNSSIVAQEIRNENRLDEMRAGGFAWQSWPSAEARLVASIKKREPRYDIYFKDAGTTDFTLTDVDRNGRPDLIVYFWGACGNRGCPINVYFDVPQKPVVYYYGWTVRPYQKGVMLDDGYYQL